VTVEFPKNKHLATLARKPEIQVERVAESVIPDWLLVLSLINETIFPFMSDEFGVSGGPLIGPVRLAGYPECS
jgi:hypothetical protein